MSDPYLEAQMRGEICKIPNNHSNSPKKLENDSDQFDVAIDDKIQKILNLYSFENESGENQFLSPEMKRKKKENELKHSLKESELKKYIDPAIEIIVKEGQNYFIPTEYNDIIDEFSTASENLKKLDLSKPLREELGNLLGISNKTNTAILNIAIAKFDDQQYSAALALFILLTVLHSKEFSYWYRAGIAAQQSENFTLAVEAFQVAITLNPGLIGAYLFAIECYLQLDQRQKAKSAYETVKSMNDIEPLGDQWREIFEYVGSLITEQA